MHGTITKTSKPDRAAIMRDAWTLWRLAQDVAARAPFDGAAIEAAARAAGASYDGAIEARNTEFRERRSVAGVKTFGDALRAAWAPVRRRAETARAEAEADRRPAPAPITGFAAERMAADCLPWGMEGERLRRLADMDRREAATRMH